MATNSQIPQAKDRLIVALDVTTRAKALKIVSELDGLVDIYKIGWVLFIKAGMELVTTLIDSGKKVFLDLKMGDIDETISGAIANLPDGVELITIHGNGATVKAAKQGRGTRDKPRLLMLTALSSQDDIDIQDIFANNDLTRKAYNFWKAEKSLEAGCEGLIASGGAVKELRENFGDKKFIIVTPGIRPTGTSVNDHKYCLTPYDAIVSGADYIVVGRPIRDSNNRIETTKEIIEEIQRALVDLSPSETPEQTHSQHFAG